MKEGGSSRGFTLVEMLIALTIFTALIGVLLQGYNQGLSLWEKGRDQSLTNQALEYRYGLLSRLFGQANVAEFSEAKGKHVPFFDGTGQHIQFISTSPVLDLPGWNRPVELKFVSQTNNTYKLIYREAPRFQDPARGINWKQGQEIILLEEITNGFFQFEAPMLKKPEDLGLTYLTKAEEHRYRDKAEWLNSFSSEQMWRVPQRVSITFTDQKGQEHLWTFILPNYPDAWSLDIYRE